MNLPLMLVCANTALWFGYSLAMAPQPIQPSAGETYGVGPALMLLGIMTFNSVLGYLAGRRP